MTEATKPAIVAHWKAHIEKIEKEYWAVARPSLIQTDLDKLTNLLEQDYQTFYPLHAKLYSLLIKKQHEIMRNNMWELEMKRRVNSFVSRRMGR